MVLLILFFMFFLILSDAHVLFFLSPCPFSFYDTIPVLMIFPYKKRGLQQAFISNLFETSSLSASRAYRILISDHFPRWQPLAAILGAPLEHL